MQTIEKIHPNTLKSTFPSTTRIDVMFGGTAEKTQDRNFSLLSNLSFSPQKQTA